MQKFSSKGFDLDKTITINDTFLPYTLELAKISDNKILWILTYIRFAVLLKLGVISNDKFKERILVLFQREDADTFQRAAHRIKDKIAFNEIIKGRVNRSDIIITASPEIFAQVLFPENRIIGLVINYELGHNYCYGHRKLTRVLDAGIDGLQSFYTDSKYEASMKAISNSLIIV
jgi:hypothetical protein